MRLNDPEVVRAEYADEAAFLTRRSFWDDADGPDPRNVAFAAVAEVAPQTVLEVGCGPGDFGERVEREVGSRVIALDLSPRMVELARSRGVDARVGDVQELPFSDGEFDCAVANWMLYHVPDLDRGLCEIARVLRPEGRLVAVTVGTDHLLELWQLVGVADMRLARDLGFSAGNGAESLQRHFQRVDVRDASGTVTVRDRAPIVRYVESSDAWRHLSSRVPEQLDEPLVARTSVVVFVADT